MSLVEFPVHMTWTVHVDPVDAISGLNGNDELTLQFICQLVALSHSLELRARLLERLGADVSDLIDGRGHAEIDLNDWQDEDYLPCPETTGRPDDAVPNHST